MSSYLSERKQRVIIDGFLSDPLDVQTGVPQGSILGPLLYVCFTNDMPESIHNHQISIMDNRDTSFNINCQECGSICCFADDSTFSKSNMNAQFLKDEIDSQYKRIIEYTRHEHRQTPTIFYLKLWTFALLFFYLDMEFLGLFGLFVDF